MGPNEGKSLLEQTICVARALMCYSPTMFFDPNIVNQKLTEYIAQYGSLSDKWFKFKFFWGDWHVHVKSDAVALGGESCRKLPEGTEVTAVFDLSSSKNSFVDKFEKAVSILESGFTEERSHAIFWEMTSETLGEGQPSPVIKEYATIFDNIVTGKIQSLKESVAACRSGFDNTKIAEFRTSLRKLSGTLVPEKPNLLMVGDPERLIAFSKHLAEEHASRRVDVFLFGSVATITDICGYCASKAQEKAKSNDQAVPFAVFNNLALILTSGPETDPVKLLGDTVQKAINTGFAKELLDIVKKYREIINGKIAAARESETVDSSLDLFYEAMQFAHGALIMLAVLRRNIGHFDAEDATFIVASFDMVDEQNVRMLSAFSNQILDFNGKQWNNWTSAIAMAKKNRGIEAANELVDDVVNQKLFYPKSFIPALLGEN